METKGWGVETLGMLDSDARPGKGPLEGAHQVRWEIYFARPVFENSSRSAIAHTS